MAVVDIIGLDGVTRTGRKWSRRDDTRVTYNETWMGPIPKIEDKADTEQATGEWDDIDVDVSAGVGVLTLSRGVADSTGGGGNLTDIDRDTQDETDPDLVTRWELVPTDLSNDLRTFSGRPEDTANTSDFQDSSNITAVTLAALAADEGNGNFTSANTAAGRYYDLRLQGADTFLRTGVTLVKTVSSSSRSALKPNWEGVDRAHKITDSFASGGPDAPADIFGVVNDMPDASALLKQWLKRGPSLRITEGQQSEITYTWLFAKLWSFQLYNGNNTP